MSDLDRLIQARLKKARKEAEAAQPAEADAAPEVVVGSEPASPAEPASQPSAAAPPFAAEAPPEDDAAREARERLAGLMAPSAAKSAPKPASASDLDRLIEARKKKAALRDPEPAETVIPFASGAAGAAEAVELVPSAEDEAAARARERLAGLVNATTTPLVLEDAVLTSPPVEGPEREDAAFERRLMKTLGAVALLAVILSVLANASWARGPKMQGTAELGKVPATRYQPQLDLDKAAVDLLPSDVLAYETIARHGVPGEGKRAAEAIYATMNMELDIQVPISVYARVEAFATEDEAQAFTRSTLARYPVKAESITVGSTPMKSGYRQDEGAWAVVWTRGQYSIYVKTSFKDKVPVEKRDFLRNVGRPVIQAVEKYQRTGKEGLKL